VPGPPGAMDARLREALREYYRHRSVRSRMHEFLGGPRRRDVSAMYITATDGHADYPEPEPPSGLSDCLGAGLEVDRSLWDRRSLLVDLDIEHANFDHPEAAWMNPNRAFKLQLPVIDAALRTVTRAGIDPLVLLSGRGFHLVWRVDQESAVFHRLACLGHVNASLAARYSQTRSPAGATIPPQLDHAYAGLGMIVEFIGHRVLTQCADANPIPVEITAIEVGPGPGGREIVSFDLSEYGDPLHKRHIRLPFSAYLKPRRFEGLIGLSATISPIFEIPLDGLNLDEAVGIARSPDAAARLSANVHTFIPDFSGPMEALLDEYESSDLAAFHKDFYREPPLPAANSFADAVCGAPLCLTWLLENPNDWLLRPAALQYVCRVLMAIGWNPRAIAHLIADVYERDIDWGEQWVRLDPFNRAMFYTRLFCGMVATGVDRLIDFNCVSQREKGYCFVPDCRVNLLPWRAKLLERRKQH